MNFVSTEPINVQPGYENKSKSNWEKVFLKAKRFMPLIYKFFDTEQRKQYFYSLKEKTSNKISKWTKATQNKGESNFDRASLIIRTKQRL